MNLRILIFLLVGAMGFVACGDDDDGPIVLPPVVATVAPNVGGPDQPNQVYIDLSTNTQTVVPRRDWDLGFSTDENFSVVLNGSNGMLAIATETSDFASVKEDRLPALDTMINIDAIFGYLISPNPKPVWLPESASWIDHPDGSWVKTAISQIEANAENNLVYVINRGRNSDRTPRGYMKIKVTRTSNGYSIQYGELNSGVGSTLEIVKDDDYNFIFMNMDLGLVQVEPKKDSWDISFTTSTDLGLSEFSSGFPVPYFFSDFIYHNRFGTSAAVVDGLATTLEDYQAFTLAGSTALNGEGKFSNDINTIGSGWRNLPMGPGAAVNDDRFYILNDSDEKSFKLLFTRLSTDSGERGHPEFIYEELR